MGRLMTRDDQMDMLRLYDAIQVTQDHDRVHVHADLSGEQMDKLVQQFVSFDFSFQRR